MKTRIWAISDTHGMHRMSIVPDNIDVIIHAGDSTNEYHLTKNLIEFEDFLDWFSNLSIPYKILIAGNHDAWATKLYNRDKVKEKEIIYLENEYVEIEGKEGMIKIFGSPYTPTFNNWYFMKDRANLDAIWRHVESDTDIWVTHGPPAGILDLTENREYKLGQVGDVSLYKRIIQKSPKFHIFGHIHNFKNCRNQGRLKHNNYPTEFINASCVEDGRFDKGLTSNGIVFEI
jgi:Icc-related predicted phosphoesterase